MFFQMEPRDPRCAAAATESEAPTLPLFGSIEIQSQIRRTHAESQKLVSRADEINHDSSATSSLSLPLLAANSASVANLAAIRPTVGGAF